MALRSPVYKPSPRPRRGASLLVREQLVGRRSLAERCTLADADLHTYGWRKRHQMRRTGAISLACASVSQIAKLLDGGGSNLNRAEK